MMSGCIETPWANWSEWMRTLNLRVLHDFFSEKMPEKYPQSDDYTVTSIREFLGTLTDEEISTFNMQYGMWCFMKFQGVTSIVMNCLAFTGASWADLGAEHECFDYKGYEVTYGMLNADGFFMTMFMPLDPDISVVCEHDALNRAFEARLEKSANANEEILGLYERGFNYDNILEFIGEENVKFAKHAGKLTNLVYSEACNDYSGEISEYQHTLNRLVTDRQFTLPTLKNMMQVKAYGGQVRAYKS